MNNLKFRAWHKEYKKWCEPYSWTIEDWMNVSFSAQGLSVTDKDGDNWCAFYKDIEIMQFTGLIDKHKRDIYEGDIVKRGDGDLFFVERFMHTYMLTWDQKSQIGIFRRRKSMDEFCQNDFEIVGNIYENNRLLTGDG